MKQMAAKIMRYSKNFKVIVAACVSGDPRVTGSISA